MDWWKKKKSPANNEKQWLIRSRERGAILLEDLIECCDGKSNPIKFFSADQIIEATHNFCKCNIPQGSPNICKCSHVPEPYDLVGFYPGMIDDHRMILVKRFRYRHPEYFYTVARDITISSMVSGQKNFMRLVGCCLEFEDPLMVYYGEKKQYCRLDLNMVVSWKRRMKIAADIATALAYLHTAFLRPFIYRIMNLGNIVLDEYGIAKLTDFSCCVSIPEGQTFFQEGRLIWVHPDDMDDDYYMNGRVSEKTDAFGFGILMQKLLTGNGRFSELYHWNTFTRWKSLEERFPNLLSKSIAEGKMREIVDPKILEEMGVVAEEERFRMEAFLVLAERCIGLRGDVPNMVEVAKELKTFLKNASTNC